MQRLFKVLPAPRPDDVNWPALQRSWWQRTVRRRGAVALEEPAGKGCSQLMANVDCLESSQSLLLPRCPCALRRCVRCTRCPSSSSSCCWWVIGTRGAPGPQSQWLLPLCHVQDHLASPLSHDCPPSDLTLLPTPLALQPIGMFTGAFAQLNIALCGSPNDPGARSSNWYCRQAAGCFSLRGLGTQPAQQHVARVWVPACEPPACMSELRTHPQLPVDLLHAAATTGGPRSCATPSPRWPPRSSCPSTTCETTAGHKGLMPMCAHANRSWLQPLLCWPVMCGDRCSARLPPASVASSNW